ncbi:MAG: hypothetical protein GX242_04755 [Clostridiales bacterium]|nr:hypothetical protein [Clostridiales bacterium]
MRKTSTKKVKARPVDISNMEMSLKESADTTKLMYNQDIDEELDPK